MTTIPQVARAMREILTTVADAAARTTRFVLRRSPLGGATFSQALVFGFLSHPQASLEELSQTAAALGVDITPQALDQRFTEAAAACLKEVLHAALARVVAAHPVAIPLLARFTAVALQDSSTLVLPDLLAPVWQGCGGNTAERTKAALKLQVRLEMQTGQLDVQLQEGRAADQAAEFPGALAAGALHLADLGYWSLDGFRALTHQGVFWLSRLQVQTAIYTAAGQRHDLLALLTAQPAVPLDMAVALGETQHLPARLLAVRVPQEVAAARRRRLREAARKKGRQASTTRLALAAWTLLVTNVPGDRFPQRQLLGLSQPQSRESGADGAETRPASGQYLWPPEMLDHHPQHGSALCRRWMPDESTQEASEHLSTIAQ
ncbi:MAG TPA: IS4 family transposase [Chloroflexota bacterium]|nr:IS4 family transposase [Chloroflexota bacterium]